MHIEDFWQASDGQDFSHAIERAQASYQTPPVGVPRVDARRFTTLWRTIEFGDRGRRVYEFSKTIDLCGAHLLGLQAAVELRALHDGPVLIAHNARYFTGKGGSSPTGYGGANRLSWLTIVGRRTGGTGITVRSGFEADNVIVRDCGGRGWEISADHNRPDMSNTNCFGLWNCAAFSCGSDGLYIDGGDANAGYANRFRAEQNDGWGIWDSSFLGNEFNAPKMVNNGRGGRDAKGLPAEPLAFLSDYPGASTLVLNPYVEGYSSIVDIRGDGLVIGGAGGKFTANTLKIEGKKATGIHTFMGPNGKVRFNRSEAVMTFEPASAEAKDVWALRTDNNLTDLTLGRQNNQRALALTDQRTKVGTTQLEPGRAWLPQGWYEGPGVKRLVGPVLASGFPPPPTSDMLPGSTWRTSTPQVGKVFEWVLVSVPGGQLKWAELSAVGIVQP